MRRTIISLLAISLLFCASAQTYKKATAPVDARVEDLLSRMTLEEKVQQFTMHGLGAVPHMSESFGVCDSPFDGLELIATQSKAAKNMQRKIPGSAFRQFRLRSVCTACSPTAQLSIRRQ